MPTHGACLLLLATDGGEGEERREQAVQALLLQVHHAAAPADRRIGARALPSSAALHYLAKRAAFF